LSVTPTIELTMYRRSKFLELLLEIRQDMAREADHDVDQFVEDLRREPVADDVATPTPAAPLNGSEIAKAAMVARKR
jgi:hypothetical protein